ncbi:hypothetical protein O181_002509 [Austropuccinia psidii MF-1]|uniref:1-phosphatidylinositol 4-kinase n=1 Tax=Austropuccinia psidii MF-1 TaxID=1389203 RepID=A0A9Q3BCD8_9BASI|nr:hypothetical protein [Austropuccinia psidii MF-1]
MDSLDLNLHSAILNSLAQFYATSTPNQLPPPPIINKLPSFVLDDDFDSDKLHALDQENPSPNFSLTLPQAHHVIAFAIYISQSASSSVLVHDQAIQALCNLIKSLTYWSIEFNLSTENVAEWPLVDELTYHLVIASLDLCPLAPPDEKQKLVGALGSLIKIFSDQFISSSPLQLITHFLPILSGLRRALGSRFFSFTIDVFNHFFPSISDSPIISPSSQLSEQLDSFLNLPETSLLDSNQIDSLKARYQALNSPLTSKMIIYSGLQQCRNVLEQCLVPDDLSSINHQSEPSTDDAGWAYLMRSAAVQKKGIGSSSAAVRDTNDRLMVMFQEYLKLYQEKLELENFESYFIEIICEIIKLLIVCILALDNLSNQVLNQLLSLHSEDSIILHSSIQITVTESLIILAQNFHHLIDLTAQTLRSYILSTIPQLDLDLKIDSQEPNPSVLAAAHGLEICVKLHQSPDFAKATLYALINSINMNDSETNQATVDKSIAYLPTHATLHSPETQHIVSINALAASLVLLKKFNQIQLNSTIVPMLLLRLEGSNPSLDTAILLAIASLALDVEQQVFQDIITTFTLLNKKIDLELCAATSDLVFQTGIYQAQLKLSEALCNVIDLGELYLIELLSLFIDKAQAIQATQTALPSFHQLVNYLGALIQAIGILLQPDSSYDPRQTSSQQLSELFRNFWYVCVVFGFLSPNSRAIVSSSITPDWLIDSLRQIATKSPTLTHLTSIDYLTAQLDYNPILKYPDPTSSITQVKVKHNPSNPSSSRQLAAEQVKKQELAALIPTHSGHIRGLSFAQTIFLLTVSRLEISRAEDCRASNILDYFDHLSSDEIDPHNIFGCLVAISEKVLSTFISSFQQHAIRHNEVIHVYEEIPKVLKFAFHHAARIRALALRYCQDMVVAFPSLLCNFDAITYMLESLTLLRMSCEGEYDDEYSPKYTFYSERANLTIVLIDDYTVRQQILTDLLKSIKHWLSIAVARAPLEMKSIFLRYLDDVASPGLTNSIGNIEMGKSVALEMAKFLPPNSQLSNLPAWGNWTADLSTGLAHSFSNRMFYNGQAMYLSTLPDNAFQDSLEKIRSELIGLTKPTTPSAKRTSITQLSGVLYRAGSHVMASPKPDLDLLYRIVSLPVRMFTSLSISVGLEVWTWLIDVKPEVEVKLMAEVMNMWEWTLRRRKGLFSNNLDLLNPLDRSINFTSTDREEMHHNYNSIKRMLKPHSILLDFLLSRFQAARYKSRSVVLAIMRLLSTSFANVQHWSKHPLSRELRLRLSLFGFSICQGSRMEDSMEHILRDLCYNASFNWFALPPSFGFGSNRLQHESELRLLQELLEMIKFDQPVNAYHTSSLDMNSARHFLPGRLTLSTAGQRHAKRNRLLQLFLEHELLGLMVWHNPLNDPKKGKDFEASVTKSINEAEWRAIVQSAWTIDPELAIRLVERTKNTSAEGETRLLVRKFPHQARKLYEALNFFVGEFDPMIIPNIHQILYWKKTPVLTALTYFSPRYDNDSILLQYAMRVLEEHPIGVTFFYIPQVVQALRRDNLGYIERFISETAKVSQLFCHQIIWNMKANAYRGDDAVEPDPMKPSLDRIVESIVDSLSGEAKAFYETEFDFFDKVTGISKTLKDYLKKDKAEKKAKITEELAKIQVVKGVYLPSNPDGTVIDIDRNSGRPLQSHAKTPFMATFKVYREKIVHIEEDPNNAMEEDTDFKKGTETWQAAIFKVGDDCRQDVLALQLIAIHKTIYETMCLDLHLVPYRVTATAPGCGVIDVIPDATSRDEMGRAKINDLQSFFVGKFGPADSIGYQTARMNFIRSMAAYSVMCYLIQIKDRHNGNIMIDGEGHIAHIDFGFLFDIGPGGIKFEPNSFKLTAEMIILMGGQSSAGFRLFQELVIKAFLIARPFSKEIVTCVRLMSETQLPSFKGESTMNKLMERFKPQLTEREAAIYMQSVINNAKQNGLSLLYDEFQWVTNEIPYTQRDWIARAS